MNLRLALYQLAEQYQLDAVNADKLERVAGLRDEPPGLTKLLARAVAMLAAGLGGLGIIMWVAANWETFGRFGRFALLEVVVLAMCFGALWRPAARVPLALVAMLAIGALFAYFGQTYQTGADPWQLFALWAALSLPLCLATRSDALWAPWALVVITGISLWVYAHTGHRWRVDPDDFQAHAVGWTSAALLVAVLSPALRRFTGAGVWSLRTALTLAVVTVTASALGGLFTDQIAAYYGLALALLIGAAVLLALPRLFDVYGLSAISLGLNTLLVAGLARLLFHDYGGGDPIGQLLLLGLVAAGLLAATVSIILRVARRHSAQGDIR